MCIIKSILWISFILMLEIIIGCCFMFCASWLASYVGKEIYVVIGLVLIAITSIYIMKS